MSVYTATGDTGSPIYQTTDKKIQWVKFKEKETEYYSLNR